MKETLLPDVRTAFELPGGEYRFMLCKKSTHNRRTEMRRGVRMESPKLIETEFLVKDIHIVYTYI